MNITKASFGTTLNHETAYLYRMENSSGAYVTVTNYGCRIVEICVPDKNQSLTDIALGLRDFNEYIKDDASLGAVVGRYANRIANGVFTLNDKEYHLAINNKPNHLHGGPSGFATRLWNAKMEDDCVVFTRISQDGEEGYPGNLTLHVTYSLSEDNELLISYEATTDAHTILNLTNHCYFNLNGQGSDTVLNHELLIDSDYMTKLNTMQIPTGTLLPVEQTPFDFRTMRSVEKKFKNDDEQFAISGTYDHNYVINGNGFREAAVLQSKESGIRMTCFTDQPGLQLYIPCYTLHQKGKGDVDYKPFSSICLETQHYPNSCNIEGFPSVVLKANETFRSKTAYHFSTIS